MPLQTTLDTLNQLKIPYKSYDHPPVYTVDEAKEHSKNIPGTHCKNLFLKDKAKKLYLLIAHEDQPINLKALQNKIGSKRLSFASAELLKSTLNLEPGAVSPFGALFDTTKQTTILLDQALTHTHALNFHPCINTATITIAPQGLLTFFEYTNHNVQYVNFTNND